MMPNVDQPANPRPHSESVGYSVNNRIDEFGHVRPGVGQPAPRC